MMSGNEVENGKHGTDGAKFLKILEQSLGRISTPTWRLFIDDVIVGSK